MKVLVALIINILLGVLVGLFIVNKRSKLDVVATLFSSLTSSIMFVLMLLVVNDELLNTTGLGGIFIELFGEGRATYLLFGGCVVLMFLFFLMTKTEIKIVFLYKEMFIRHTP